MVREERVMAMAKKRAMASDNKDNDHDNNDNRDNSNDQDDSGNADDDTDNDGDDNDNKDGAAAVVGGFVGGGSVSSSNHGGIDGSGFSGWWVVAVVGVVICRTIRTMRGKHDKQPKEGCGAKMPEREAKQQATMSQHDGATKRQEGGATQMPAQQWQPGQ
jgi:hypothetical protein